MILKIILSLLASLLGFLVFFLRDPERTSPTGDLVICPADGLVTEIKKEEGWDKIVIFMNPLNVHVQRFPYPGKVIAIERIAGPSLPGFMKKAAQNSQASTTMETKIGKIVIKQIVGILVRRIQTFAKVGDNVKTGQKLGRIIFGSRVELWLPENKTEIKVAVSQKVLAGITIAAVPK